MIDPSFLPFFFFFWQERRELFDRDNDIEGLVSVSFSGALNSLLVLIASFFFLLL